MLNITHISRFARLGTLSMLVSLATAQAQDSSSMERRRVDDPRVLLLQALQSPDGEAHGTLAGDKAAMVSKMIAGGGPLNIDVRTAKRYQQPGCARLAIRFTQAGVVMKAGEAAQDKKVDVGIDYCTDGRPPRSTN